MSKKGTENNIADSLEWEEVYTEHIVQDKWIDFRKSAYRFPDGTVFEPFYSYSRRDYVVIVASDEAGDYLCVRQFRQGIEEVTTEFPAGGVERTDGKEYDERSAGRSGVGSSNAEQNKGKNNTSAEDALEAAKRELLEETGYESNEWKHLLTVPSNATIADNYAHIFSAKNCKKKAEQSLDETEFLNVVKLPKSEIETMVSKGDFKQAVHCLAWLLSQKG